MEEISFLEDDERDRSPLTFNDIVYSHLDSDVVKVIFNETAVINDPEELCVDAFRTEVEKNHNSVGWLFDGARYGCDGSIEDVQSESILIGDIFPTKRVRHKIPKPDEWVQNRRKRLRQEGKSYVTRRGILMPEKQFSIKECSHCPLKCHQFFKPDELKEIFDNFWKLDLQNKRQYLSQLVEETNVKRVRTKSAQSRRTLTRHYFLIKNASQRKKVCRSFFMEVFKISSNFIKTVCKKRLKSGIVEKDLRGKTAPKNKRPPVVRDLIRNHINQFRRSQSKPSEREYLPSSLTLKSMYSSYIDECEKKNIEPEKYWLYADVFHKDFSLHFRKPPKCSDTVYVKLSPDETSKELTPRSLEKVLSLNEGIVPNDSNELAVIIVGPDDGQILHPTEDAGDSSIDYKILYEKEVKKNEELQKEVQKLKSLLENSQGQSGYFL